MKRILFASSEAVPFVKTGGLADVVGTLPRYFDKKEYDVRIILPRYQCITESRLKSMKFKCQTYVDLGWRRQYVGVYTAEHAGIKYYFLENEFYFKGPTPYASMFIDSEKFAYFSKAILEVLPLLDWTPDVIHCNDWQTGLLPVFLHTLYGSDPFYSDVKTVMSIHNLKFQGKWNINQAMDITGLPAHIFNSEELEAYGDANYLKGGIVYADAITTVSPSYAQDITKEYGGEGLDGMLRVRQRDLYGILNGIDNNEYDPQTDPALKYNYGIDDFDTEKPKNKAELQTMCHLPVSKEVFTIGIVSRLTDQKGFDLITEVLDEMLSTMNLQLYVLGSGEDRYEGMFRHYQEKYPEKISVYIGYSEEHANRIYGSCDAFLMPSLFEPCGLSQMMAMRYGTIPIVRETGGLKDTVKPFNEFKNTGTGFSFEKYNAQDMLHVIRYAYETYYYKPDYWLEIQKRAMKQDYSWNQSAREYEKLYDSLF